MFQHRIKSLWTNTNLLISQYSFRSILFFAVLLNTSFNDLRAQSSQSWVYECRYLCSADCRGKMFMEGVDIKCACDDCQPMLTLYEGSRLVAIYAGRRAMEEVSKAGQNFYHYADELNDYISKFWPNDGYQITRVEYHLTSDARFVKYFMESLSGQKTAVVFMTDKRSNHYRLRCRTNCPFGPEIISVDRRPQEQCSQKDCKTLKEKIQLQQF
ncbi:hypothetical protein [Thermaurantimonas aggregans]|nr:hypothetical protein [Thermaurantimonas aggregans]